MKDKLPEGVTNYTVKSLDSRKCKDSQTAVSLTLELEMIKCLPRTRLPPFESCDQVHKILNSIENGSNLIILFTFKL